MGLHRLPDELLGSFSMGGFSGVPKRIQERNRLSGELLMSVNAFMSFSENFREILGGSIAGLPNLSRQRSTRDTSYQSTSQKLKYDDL